MDENDFFGETYIASKQIHDKQYSHIVLLEFLIRASEKCLWHDTLAVERKMRSRKINFGKPYVL